MIIRITSRLRFLITFLIGVASVTLVFSLYYYQQFILLQKSLQTDESLRLELASDYIGHSLEEIVADIRWLADSVAMENFIIEPNPYNKSRVQKDFINLAKSTGHYDQVRMIGKSGREIIRVNYNQGSPVTVTEDRLQDKSSRYYFQQALTLSKGDIYISPMDLNVEGGKLDQPLKPVIRILLPLFKPGESQLIGILVLNFMASTVLSNFDRLVAGSWGTTMIINQQGNWLYRQDKPKEWRLMQDSEETFASNYPSTWKAMSSDASGFFQNSKGLFIFTGLPTYSHTDAMNSVVSKGFGKWKIVSHVLPEQVSFSIWKPVQENSQISLLILLAVTLLSYIIARLRTKNIEYTRAIKKNESQYRNLFENMADGYALQKAVFDDNGNPCDFRYIEINEAFENILGVKREKVIGKTVLELFPDVEPYWLKIFGDVATTGKPGRLEQFGGTFGRYFELSASSPGYGLVAVIFADVTERKKNEEQLRQAAVVFNNTNEAVMVTDAETKVISINDAFTKITGFELDDVVGKKPSFQKSGKHDYSFYRNMWRSLKEHDQWQGEIWNRRKDGVLYPVWENISVVKDDKGKVSNYISIFSDISTIKRTERKLNHLAHHDSLTGLANRLAFTANLEQALERAQRHQNKVALLFLDLDHFKKINDTLGHAAGDRVLQVVAKRLKQSVRAQDVVCRLGGDEFTIILEELSKISDIRNLSTKIIKLVSTPITLGEQNVTIATSVGISIYPDDADNAQDLAKAGDAAMYSAKSRGRRTFAFFSAELDHADSTT